MQATLIVHNAKVTTLSSERSQAAAFAVGGESIVAVGDDAEVLRQRGEQTLVIDAGGRRVIPGLNDSHIHAVRGGVLYHLELRWDGVDSLARGLEMIREQAPRTPKGQWVRVMGGWSPYQFRERRMPSVAELNAAAPDTPVLVLFGYSEVFLNRAGVAALQLTSAARRRSSAASISSTAEQLFRVEARRCMRRSDRCRRSQTPPTNSTPPSTFCVS
jgi:predicted amidohydrolase YtcJ